ncbi:MAG: AAA family ATPase [Candidatus Thermoplasmatota archaeon]|nr:AAA family ATPase [Candidatus Thermoplasmatota archaeon]MEE3270057.1 AAA family ATPase [Candidatus Thermoplasmatota archaeon]
MASVPAGWIVDRSFRLALTGTPGTGKSTVAGLLFDDGFEVLTVESLADQNNLEGHLDPDDGAVVIDTGALNRALFESWQKPPSGLVVVDGHLSHHLPCDAVAVLRCSPDILRNRLSERGYHILKVEANVEWELIGGSWNEYESGVPWIEFDTSVEGAESVAASISGWIADGFKPTSQSPEIDWIERMSD